MRKRNYSLQSAFEAGAFTLPDTLEKLTDFFIYSPCCIFSISDFCINYQFRYRPVKINSIIKKIFCIPALFIIIKKRTFIIPYTRKRDLNRCCKPYRKAAFFNSSLILLSPTAPPPQEIILPLPLFNNSSKTSLSSFLK